MSTRFDAVVVGAGPNGLAAAITLAEAGASVLVLEQGERVGGGVRTEALTLPGFAHDVCSAVYPLAIASPFFSRLPLERHGVRWIQPPLALAHPLEGGEAALLSRSLEETVAALEGDGPAYGRLLRPFVRDADALIAEVLAPVLHLPRRPLLLARFGAQALRSARGLVDARFSGPRARALFAGLAGHSFLALEEPLTAAIGLVLAVSAHRVGWPVVEGGAQRLSDALVAHLHTLGGQVKTGVKVARLEELPPHRVALLDVTPRQLLALAGPALPSLFRRRLARFRYGPAAFKVDFALRAPVPWRAEPCRRAGTLHLGGTFDEIADAERAVADGRVPARPFVLASQPSLFDPSRAPPGQHTLWAYCHVPSGCTVDMTDAIVAQVERFAPGFRDVVLAHHTRGPAALERHNPNYVGGDINGGLQDWLQTLGRPLLRRDPYTLPGGRLFLCSASTPPGGGVHGMCGHRAALRALARLRSDAPS